MRAILAALLAAAAVSGEGSPALPPLPRAAPLAPAPGGDSGASEEERQLHALERALRQREERIQALLRSVPGVRPAAAVAGAAELAQPRRERDRALAELQQAVGEWLARTQRREQDALDIASPARQATQALELDAGSRVAIAECWRELALAEEDPAARRQALDEGLQELAALPDAVPPHLQPRVAWLAVFFHAERAQLAEDAAHAADHAARARAAAQAFAERFPASELLPAVRAMVADLPGARP